MEVSVCKRGDNMSKMKNPYPKFIIDEYSGIQVKNIEHEIWTEGYKAGRKESLLKKKSKLG